MIRGFSAATTGLAAAGAALCLGFGTPSAAAGSDGVVVTSHPSFVFAETGTQSAPSLEDLQPDFYGGVTADVAEPILRVGESVRMEVLQLQAPVRLWLLAPDGRQAAFLTEGTGAVDVQLPEEAVPFTGIYAVVATSVETEEVSSWTPFAVLRPGEALAPGQPGVNAQNTYTDRSIYPIPDWVSVPDDAAAPSASAEPPSPDPAEPGTGADGQTDRGGPAESSAPSSEPRATDPSTDERAPAGPAVGADDWILVLAGIGTVMVLSGVLWWSAARRRSRREVDQDVR